MPKFFVDEPVLSGSVTITGADAIHITKTLRMRIGEEVTVCDSEGFDCKCRVAAAAKDSVELEVVERNRCLAEPETKLTVYMALPKSDKTELVIQKCTELGAFAIKMFKSSRCIPNPDDKAWQNRLTRLRRIALESAGQSGRGMIPEIDGVMSFDNMLEEAKSFDMALFLFERATEPVKNILNSRKYKTAAVIIGPEGGFSDEEARCSMENGIIPVSLGRRILRCETAAITAAAIVMFHQDEMAL